MKAPTPFPGSNAARDAGCICPVLDNGHGDPSLARDRGGWVIAGGCPLHAPEPWSDGAGEPEPE